VPLLPTPLGPRPKVRAAGGLLVLGTSLQESGRIEAQLRGRAGRQGDPGTTQMMFDVTDPALRQLGDSGREWRPALTVDLPLGAPPACCHYVSRQRPLQTPPPLSHRPPALHPTPPYPAPPHATPTPLPAPPPPLVNRLWTVIPATAGLAFMDMPLLQTTIDSIQKNQERFWQMLRREMQQFDEVRV
jgi:hypothetical protein